MSWAPFPPSLMATKQDKFFVSATLIDLLKKKKKRTNREVEDMELPGVVKKIGSKGEL